MVARLILSLLLLLAVAGCTSNLTWSVTFHTLQEAS